MRQKMKQVLCCHVVNNDLSQDFLHYLLFTPLKKDYNLTLYGSY